MLYLDVVLVFNRLKQQIGRQVNRVWGTDGYQPEGEKSTER